MEVSGTQLKLARVLLDWSREDAEKKTGVSSRALQAIEKGRTNPKSATLKKLVTTYSLAGVEFVNGGVVPRESGFIKLSGHDGFNTFLDDVYETVLHNPCPVRIFNIDARHWPKWAGAEKWQAHVERMNAIKDQLNTRILIREGDNFFPASSYAEYRYSPADKFNEETVYLYGDKFATLTFEDNMVTISVEINKQACSAFSILYDLYWKTAAKPY